LSSFLTKFAIKTQFGSDARERFYTKIVQLLDNGVNLDTTLSQLQKVAGRRKNTTLIRFYGSLRNVLANGGNIGQALAPYLPSSESIMIETGANTGKLTVALSNTVQMMKQQKKLKKAIVGSMAYPVMLFIMLILALYLVSTQIIPIFAEVLPLDQWEGLSLKVANASIFVREYGLTVLIGFFVMIAAITWSLPNWTGRSRLLVEKTFPWNIYRLWQGSAFLLAVASLMSAGVKLDEVSLRKLGQKTSPYLKQRIHAIQRQMVAGMNLGEAMNRTGYKFPDEDIIDDILVYATLKGFDESIYRITNRWIDDLVENITSLMKGVNTLMLFAVSAVIGALITSFYDIFQMINAQG